MHPPTLLDVVREIQKALAEHRTIVVDDMTEPLKLADVLSRADDWTVVTDRETHAELAFNGRSFKFVLNQPGATT